MLIEKILSKRYFIVIPLLLSLLLHWNVFSYDLIGFHVWRQTQTETVTRNFAAANNSILNPTVNNLQFKDGIQRMEFPLMQWCFAKFHQVFGYHLVISRILTFSLGALLLLFFRNLIFTLTNNRIAANFGSWIYCWSPLFYYYCVNPLPDNLAIVCSIAGLYFTQQFYTSQKSNHFIIGVLLICIGFACKLPYLLFIVFPILSLVFSFYSKKISANKTIQLFAFVFVFTLIPAAWYFWVIPQWGGNGVVLGIFDNQISLTRIKEILWFHFSAALPELYLNYATVLFFIAGVYFLIINLKKIKLLFIPYLTALFLFICYFFYEINMIDVVHDYYMFPFLPFIFIIATAGFIYIIRSKIKWLKILATIAFFIMPLTAYLRIQQRWDIESPGFEVSFLKHKKEINDFLPPFSKCIVGNDNSGFITLYYLNRKGWNFNDNKIDISTVKKYENEGADYFIFNDSINQLNDSLILYLGAPQKKVGNLTFFQIGKK
jgi:hypothetical protein